MSEERQTITILETSDLHGSILPIQYADNSPMEVGLAKIAALIRREQAAGGLLLTVDNGDLIQGTPLAYYHARIDNSPTDPAAVCLGLLGYDAAVIGNHEFNYGMDVLKKAINESAFPWLSANLLSKRTGEPVFGKPYLVKEFPGGIRVGLLGLTTHYIPNWENPRHIEEIEFEDALESARKWVARIRQEERVDVMVVSYHGGFERDLTTGEPTETLTGENQGYQMCLDVPGIDVLLTGHQHRAIAGMKVNGVTVLQPANQGRFLGRVNVRLVREDGRWKVEDAESELLSVEGIEADPEIVRAVAECEKNTQIWLDQPIGRLNGDMLIRDPMEVRVQDHPLIEFINKVQMETSGASISNTALFDNFAPGFTSDITMRDVVSNYIYPNTLKVIRVTGRDIRDALEQTAKYFAPYKGSYEVSPDFSTPKPQHYNYDMWEGIEYELNVSRPRGERVTKLLVDGKPIDLEQEYDVVMNNYRAGGGGNYPMFQGKPVVRDIPTDVSELIANYILERGTIEATLNRNWRVVHDKMQK